MFRKLRNRVVNAVNGGNSNNTANDDPVHRLQVMVRPQTVSSEQAREALQACDGDIQQAAERLLLSGIGSETVVTSDDSELERALQASLQVNDDDDDAAMQRAMVVSRQSAASRNAGRAAMARMVETPSTSDVPVTGVSTLPSAVQQLQKHHPDVIVPKTVQQDKQDQRILRLSDRLASYAPAVDTLVKALTALRNDPAQKKFHTIDASNPGFQRSLGPVPPGLLNEWLSVVHYHTVPQQPGVYHLSFVDQATLYLAISALERVQKESVTYRTAKRQWRFQKTFQQIVEGATIKCNGSSPSSSAGTGAWITVMIGEVAVENAEPGTLGSTLRCRFDGDDVVEDVLKWIANNDNSKVWDALTTPDGPWCLWDKNASKAMDCTDPKIRNSTLQSVNWWPSGRLIMTMREIQKDNDMK